MTTFKKAVAAGGLIALLVTGVAGTAMADPAHKHESHYKMWRVADNDYRFNGDRDWRFWRHDDDDNRLKVRIGDRDRQTIERYIAKDYRKSCPPGLAKKHNGCLPPGQAKKRYTLGRRLDGDVVYFPLPRDLLDRLAPPPRGYQYVQVDKDVLLVTEAGKKVIDAITLLSAVGK